MKTIDELKKQLTTYKFKKKGDIKIHGFRVMMYDSIKKIAKSGMHPACEIKLNLNSIIEYPNKNPYYLYLDWINAVDYYSIYDINVLLQVEFNVSDIVYGSQTFRKGDMEFQVQKSKLINFWIYKG